MCSTRSSTVSTWPDIIVAGTAVERAEVAVRDADVRVVEVPVDDERHAIRVVLPVPHRVRRAADRDEITRAEERNRVVVGDPLAVDCALEDLRDGRSDNAHATAAPVVCTNRNSGTVSNRPASRQSSRNV